MSLPQILALTAAVAVVIGPDTLDLQIEKAFDMGQYGRLALSANIFNLTNSNTIIRRNREVSSTSLNSIQENISPRALRLGVRYSF